MSALIEAIEETHPSDEEDQVDKLEYALSAWDWEEDEKKELKDRILKLGGTAPE